MKNRLLSACLLMGLSVSRAVGIETNSRPHSIPRNEKRETGQTGDRSGATTVSVATAGAALRTRTTGATC